MLHVSGIRSTAIVSLHVMVCYAGGRPMSPRTRRLLKIRYYQWADLRIGEIIKVSMVICPSSGIWLSWEGVSCMLTRLSI